MATPQTLARRFFGALVLALPLLWLAVFFLVPFLIVLKISLSDAATAQPPYTPVFEWSDWRSFIEALDLENFELLLGDPLYWDAAVSSVRIAGISTLLLLLVGFPVAYAMSRAAESWRPLLVGLVILPFWTSFLIRIYAWIGILKPDGYLNQALLAVGAISEPLTILNIPRERRSHFMAPGVGHYGIFSGRRWRGVIYPRVRDFIRANS